MAASVAAPALVSSINREPARKPSALTGEMADERRRRRRELRIGESSFTERGCARFPGSDDNTAARIEGVGLGKELSVLRDRFGSVGVIGSSLVGGAVAVGMFSSARSTERQSRRPGGSKTSAKVQSLCTLALEPGSIGGCLSSTVALAGVFKCIRDPE